jgi:hypothetical protein
MPRKSIASLAIMPVVGPKRPKPPKRLSEAEAELWRECCDSKAADFFDLASQPILEQYCQMVCLARDLAADIAATPRHDVVTRVKLLAAFDTATKAAVSHARALRITQQSRVSKTATAQHSSGTAVSLHRPWESPAKKLWE